MTLLPYLAMAPLVVGILYLVIHEYFRPYVVFLLVAWGSILSFTWGLSALIGG